MYETNEQQLKAAFEACVKGSRQSTVVIVVVGTVAREELKPKPDILTEGYQCPHIVDMRKRVLQVCMSSVDSECNATIVEHTIRIASAQAVHGLSTLCSVLQTLTGVH